VVYATDGLNRKTGLKLLEDDRHFFPDYNAAFLVRQDTLEAHPEVEAILNQLAGQISTEQMAELTYQVDVLGRTVDEVAREFLTNQRLLAA
jgi:osmoprotectant transport system permease protein